MENALISFPMFGEGYAYNISNHITVFGLPIYLYGIVIALGFLLAAVYLLFRRKDFGLSQDNVLDIFICAIPSAIVGARLYYIIFNPSEYFGAGKWQNIFDIRGGGLAVYGGIILSVAVLLIYVRKKKLSAGALLDVSSLGLLIGQAVGRWGNFFNREAFGTTTNLPWKMGLTSGSTTIYVHPTFLYESLWNIIGFVLLHFYSKKKRKYNGQIFLMYLAWYGFGRYIIEGLRTDSLYLFNTDIRISQLVAALTMSAAIVLLLVFRIKGRTFADTPVRADAAEPADAEDADCDDTETAATLSDENAEEALTEDDNEEAGADISEDFDDGQENDEDVIEDFLEDEEDGETE